MVLRSKQHVDRVIVVDDGSDDATAEVAALAGAEVICHPENKGKGVALKTGFAAASGADIIVTMDTDGQHNPAEIPVLVAPILSGEADMVNGSRYLDGKDRNTPMYRRVGQKVLDMFSNINTQGLILLIPRAVLGPLQVIPWMYSSSGTPDSVSRARC